MYTNARTHKHILCTSCVQLNASECMYYIIIYVYFDQSRSYMMRIPTHVFRVKRREYERRKKTVRKNSQIQMFFFRFSFFPVICCNVYAFRKTDERNEISPIDRRVYHTHDGSGRIRCHADRSISIRCADPNSTRVCE